MRPNAHDRAGLCWEGGGAAAVQPSQSLCEALHFFSRGLTRDLPLVACPLQKENNRVDLLRHFTPTPRKVSLGHYTAPDWYTHHSKPPAEDSKLRGSAMQDHTSHDEAKTYQPTSYQHKRGPFDFDMKSVWQRDADDKEDEEKKEQENGIQAEGSSSSTKEEIKLPAIEPRYPHRTPQPVVAKESHEGNRLYFPPMPAHNKNEPVNFSKLMSSGYGDEWLQERDEWEKKNSELNDSLLPSEYQKKIEKRQRDPETSQSESTQTDN